ncbi:MAG: hypothetical protein U5N21_15080 [Rhodococcus sp. (in: high G+C Gram-positive bacteria)]|nr:hypothetical protein [Rhodococcus sp. (in: high G+C Gram-positive bacteria)]
MTEPWAAADHWAAHDRAVWVAQSGHRLIEFGVTIASPDDGTVLSGSLSGDGDRKPFELPGRFGNVRHTGAEQQFCLPCARSLHELRTQTRRWADLHWGGWSPRAHRKHALLQASIEWQRVIGGFRGTFTRAADVPDWLRRVTDGALIRSYSDSLCVARIEGRIDWPAMLTQYPDDLRIVVDKALDTDGDLWSRITKAYNAIGDSGIAAHLTVDLEVTAAGDLVLVPYAVGSVELDTTTDDPEYYLQLDPRHAALIEHVTATLSTGHLQPAGYWPVRTQ